LHASVANELKQIIREAIETHPEGVSVSEIRERLDTSRKFAVPFCEYLDRSGFTKRMGDRRVLA
jgi:selenocysteine-specific elongation factor